MAPRRRFRHAARRPLPLWPVPVALVATVAGAVTWWTVSTGGGARPPARDTPTPSSVASEPSPSAPVTPSPTISPRPSATDPGAVAGPINTNVPGLTTFRGNATRDYYGEGPIPAHPKVLWSYPDTGSLCASSSAAGVTKVWCGTGWTAQPNVIPHPNGTIEVRFGAYDDHYHFLNGRTGQPIHPDLVTGDLAKGAATSDPAGYPLYYAGSRDNDFRVIALDRPAPTVLWSMNANTTVPDPRWNNDWDGAALAVGDYLLEGGENSWFYVVRLHRHYDGKGLVQVDPKIVLTIPGWDAEELAAIHDDDISIENSVAFRDGVVYFANSGGLVQGWDIRNVLHGGIQARRVFRFWTGDDTDASIVIDPEGYLYVGSEYQRFNARSREVGQLMKLDPRKPADPLVWSIHDTTIAFEGAGGTWSTPALYGGYVYWPTADGLLREINRDTGRVVWTVQLAGPLISSPVAIDRTLIEGDCAGVLHAFDISHPRALPKERWRLQLPGCIESTPAVWHGMLWLGTRAGKLYGIGEA